MNTLENFHNFLEIREEDYCIVYATGNIFPVENIISVEKKYGEVIKDFLNFDFIDKIANAINPIPAKSKYINDYIDECYQKLKNNNNEIVLIFFLEEYRCILLDIFDDPNEDIVSNVKFYLYSLIMIQENLLSFIRTGEISNGLLTMLKSITNIQVRIDFSKTTSYNFLYETRDIYSLLAIDIKMIKDKSIIIKKCANCGKYFIPSNRSDEIYCDNVFRSGKTCKQVGYEEKEKKDPFKSLYTKARKTQHARIHRNIENKPNYKEAHYIPWRTAAEKARDYYKSINDLDGFQKWIEDNKDSF